MNLLSSEIEIGTKKQLSDYWFRAYKTALPMALWRLPKQSQKQLIVGFEGDIPTKKVNFEELPTGFAISPFLNPDGEQTLFIEADLYARFDAFNTLIEEKSIVQRSQQPIVHCKLPTTDQRPSTVGSFQTIVAEAVSAIEAGQMHKVVLSRQKQITLSDNFQPLNLFDKLCEAYPSAFVSLVYLPHLNQLWLGASPETLVGIDQNNIFRTMSLAGTQSAFDENGESKSVKYATWTQKEIEEQAYVSRYIIECLKKIRVREFDEEGPKTVIAGNLMHLRTDFKIDMEAINFPQLGSVMLELLHPTSAVCGMPKAPAMSFILEKEGYDRSFYAGFLGPVNIENQSALFVNLRCMKIENQSATLFAGAGITEDSIPEKEWIETELKFQTLSKFL